MTDVDSPYDGLLLNIARQHDGIQPFMETFFSFLQRKTDFFTDPRGNPEKVVLDTLRKFQERAAEARKQKEKELKERQIRENIERERAKKRAEEEAAKKAQPKIVEIPDDEDMPPTLEAPGATGVDDDEPPPLLAPGEESETKKKEESGESKKDGEDDDEGKGMKPNVGNGGTGVGYVWTQTLQELEVKVELGMNLKSRDCDVVISARHLKVAIKRGRVIIDGELAEMVKTPECFWTLEDGHIVVVHLTKYNQMEWWKNVVKGHPEINVQKVQPENSKLGDLDGETRQTVEKMMFDQRQKQLGLPTSEEQQKRDMLAKFMAAHPEMDFSNAKFS
eukprot:NODE_2120_length_1289_cov_68.337097_g1928_i0.p1 GENE.NODE_2120_length_1289_cov_68.337097_g1928_i0~~NODE_2120_length_1289_cov_68.337097_g1928_i0.p1  ORF type:complete len:334 (-),score=108.50 NODE_2120_length_1289_cov_68.337097_g1928_i0:142-1143(-)